MLDVVIHKAVEWLSDDFVGAAKLDNNVLIFLRADGSALGCDGRTYFVVTGDDENGDCVVLGYRAEISQSAQGTPEHCG